MRYFFISLSIFLGTSLFGQRINQTPDTLRKPQTELSEQVAKRVQEGSQDNTTADDMIKNQLVSIALKNPMLTIDDASIEIAQLNRKKAGASWLNSISLGGNVNEFVVQNSTLATLYPKYNAGLSLPLGLFSTVKNAKRVADQEIIIAKSTKVQHELQIRAETLTRYEDFKEKSELVTLQNISLANNLDDYKIAQKSFEDGIITIEALNKIYQNYMTERNKLVTYRRDLNASVISLEQILGMPLDKAVPGLSGR